MAQPVPTVMDRGPQANRNPQPPAPEQKLPTAQVVIEVDGKVVNQHVLNKSAMTIGRLSANDIQVPSQLVSRWHARIIASNGDWVIEDAESLNGLIYQGQRIDRLILTPSDRVFLSPRVVLQYQTTS
jgi:pSer/pThr/pTyr-binding forkhead associated (FHA) protein